MLSMAPSSFTAGASGPVATRATAATMGAKRSSMACTSSMGEGVAGEAAGFGGGAGFRFTLRLSHARIARHGHQALSASDSAPPSGCSASRRTVPLLALAAPPGAELEGLDLDPVPALGARGGEADLEGRGGPRVDDAGHVDASPAHHAAALVEPLRLDDHALARLARVVPHLPLDEDAGGAFALALEGEDEVARGLRGEGVGLGEERTRPQGGQEQGGKRASDHSYRGASRGLSCAPLRAGEKPKKIPTAAAKAKAMTMASALIRVRQPAK